MTDQLNTALADFGDNPAARRRGQESRKRWRESVKAIVPRAHVVHTRPSTPDDHRPRDVERQASYAPDEWRPQYRATRSLSDRAPFATALSGIDVERMSISDYAWLAGE